MLIKKNLYIFSFLALIWSIYATKNNNDHTIHEEEGNPYYTMKTKQKILNPINKKVIEIPHDIDFCCSHNTTDKEYHHIIHTFSEFIVRRLCYYLKQKLHGYFALEDINAIDTSLVEKDNYLTCISQKSASPTCSTILACLAHEDTHFPLHNAALIKRYCIIQSLGNNSIAHNVFGLDKKTVTEVNKYLQNIKAQKNISFFYTIAPSSIDTFFSDYSNVIKNFSITKQIPTVTICNKNTCKTSFWTVSDKGDISPLVPYEKCVE